MRGSRLVLVKWRGDVVAAHTLAEREPLNAVTTPPGLGDAGAEGVSVEVHDVTQEQRAVPPRPPLDIMTVLGVAASVGVHIGLVVLALVVTAVASSGPSSSGGSAQDAAEIQAAMVRDYMLRIAENEGAPKASSPQDRETAPALPPEPPVPAPTPPTDPTASPDGPPLAQNDAPPPTEKPHPEQAETPPPKEGVANGSTGHDREMRSRAVCVQGDVPKNDGPKCTRTVVAEGISTQPGCFVDTVVKAGESGTLTYPCSGDGEATVTFAGKTFHGAVIGGRLEACTGTSYPWSDGCTWNSAQRVSGSIASGTLRFGYAEAPEVTNKERQWCASACTATGRIRVQSRSSDGTSAPTSGTITL